MASAIIQGMLRAKICGAEDIIAACPDAQMLQGLQESTAVRVTTSNEIATKEAPIVLLCVKPQEAATAIEQAGAGLDGKLLISIAAGLTLGTLEKMAPRSRVIRAMPNTPAAVGRGISGAYASAGVSPDQRAMADALLGAIGQVEWLDDEALIDAVTALSGSGPAYVFLLAECMALAGEKAGLPRETAQRLARATIEGSGELMFREPQTAPAQLRVNVTSPGGTTAAALEVLMGAEGLAPLMERAIAAAKRRAGELSG